MRRKGSRWGPWLHASLVGVAAVLAYMEGQAGTYGPWVALVAVFFSRLVGWLVQGGPHHKVPRGTVVQQVKDLQGETRRVANLVHGMTNQVTVLVGEVDLLAARLINGEADR